MKRFFDHLTVRIVAILIILVLPMNIFALLIVHNSNQDAYDQIRLSLQNTANIYMTDLDNRLDQADNYIHDMWYEDPDCNSVLDLADISGTEYLNARHRYMLRLSEEIMKGTADGFFMYDREKDDWMISMASAYGGLTGRWQKILDERRTDTSVSRWELTEMDGRIWAYHSISMKNAVFGSIICLTPLQREILSGSTYGEIEAVFSDEPETAEHRITAEARSGRGNICLSVRIPEEAAYTTLDFWQRGQIVIAVVYLGLIPVLYLFLRKQVLYPLGELNRAHYELQTGNPDYRIRKEAGSTEFRHAYDSFNEMADHIHDLKIENMEKELARQKLMLNNLQLQIRPHFLLNMFNMILALAETGDTGPIRTLIIYLSDYFRYIFRSGKDLELMEKELNLIEKYIEVSKRRYPGEVEYYSLVDPEVRFVRIPPLLLHNFVENAILHAKENGKVIHIMLCAEYDEGRVNIQISDDGTGLDEETVARINREEFQEEEGKVHVGLKNSLMRLRYFYGKEAGITVESEPGSATVFTLEFPYDLGGSDSE